VNIQPETLAEICNIDKVCCIKDSSGNMQHFLELLYLTEPLRRTGRVSVFQGNTPQIAPALLLGADGIVPIFAPVLPNLYHRLFEAGSRGDIALTYELQKVVLAFNKVFGLAPSNISVNKFVFNILGLSSKSPFHPCEPLTEAQERRVRAFVKPFIRLDKSLGKEMDVRFDYRGLLEATDDVREEREESGDVGK
jgi:dihydrodipicolinate synthase/N-acetylneuraminate lyase